MIIQATFEHLESLTELFEAYRHFYKKDANKEGAKQFLKARIAAQESVIFMAYTDDNEAVGFTQLYPLFSSTRMGRVWLLNDLYVAENHRGKGFSKQLIERAKQLAKETGAVSIMLETAKTNEIGNNLYPSVGFELDTDFNWYSCSTF